MPALEKVWQASKDDITILGLDYLESPELGQAMADRTGVTYPLGRDEKGTLLRSLGGVGLPYTVLVGKNGTILATHSGALTEAQFTELVKTATGR
jgi:cytochrome c biogenesis protein CcmG/thiol:disulfide interchange protein DsbE